MLWRLSLKLYNIFQCYFQGCRRITKNMCVWNSMQIGCELTQRIVFIRQNVTSTDVRFWRIKTVPELKGFKKLRLNVSIYIRSRIKNSCSTCGWFLSNSLSINLHGIYQQYFLVMWRLYINWKNNSDSNIRLQTINHNHLLLRVMETKFKTIQ